jgi:hypothetical protein
VHREDVRGYWLEVIWEEVGELWRSFKILLRRMKKMAGVVKGISNPFSLVIFWEAFFVA